MKSIRKIERVLLIGGLALGMAAYEKDCSYYPSVFNFSSFVGHDN